MKEDQKTCILQNFSGSYPMLDGVVTTLCPEYRLAPGAFFAIRPPGGQSPWARAAQQCE